MKVLLFRSFLSGGLGVGFLPELTNAQVYLSLYDKIVCYIIPESTKPEVSGRFE